MVQFLKMISVIWRPSSWMQFSSLSFKVVHDTGQQLTNDRTIFLTDGFLQTIQRTGFLSVNTRFQIPPEEKNTRWKIGRATARLLTNASYTNTPCSTGQVSIATEVANTEEKNADHLVPTPHPPRPTYWGLPIRKDVRFPWVTLYLLVYQ